MIGTKQLDPKPLNLDTKFSYLINLTPQISRPLEQPTNNEWDIIRNLKTKVNKSNAIQLIDPNPNWLKLRHTYNCTKTSNNPQVGFQQSSNKTHQALRTKP